MIHKFYEETDKPPDVITTRRFSVNGTAELQLALLDLSETEVAVSFCNTYLENYRMPMTA